MGQRPTSNMTIGNRRHRLLFQGGNADSKNGFKAARGTEFDNVDASLDLVR
jgi:hypothetical protein